MIIGTAGHIDHGKSALVEALTGVHPDRLAEERRRGMTLDLGFGHWQQDGEEVGMVDVPGHERFIHSMLAGAGGIDVMLLVVAADAGVQPQTEEHAAICRLLGIRQGVVALSKCDLADAARQKQVRGEIAGLLAGSAFEAAPIVAVSARTGAGMENLRRALLEAGRRAPRREAAGGFRLPLDRAFSMKGFGSVVTGTLVQGRLAVGAEAELEPVGKRVRVRGLHVHGKSVAEAAAGQRVAVNLAGLETSELHRGQELVEPGTFAGTRTLDVELGWLGNAPVLPHRARCRLHVHTAEVVATLIWLESPRWAQLRLAESIVAAPGDRFILRQLSPAATVAGGVVLDSGPPLYRRSEYGAASGGLAAFAAAEDLGTRLQLWLERAGTRGCSLAEMGRRMGLPVAAIRAALKGANCVVREHAGAALADSALEAIMGELPRAMEEYHQREPLAAGAALEALGLPYALNWLEAAAERLVGAGKLTAAGNGRYRLAGAAPGRSTGQIQLRATLEEHYRARGWTAPTLAEVLAQYPQGATRVLIADMAREKVLVECQPGWYLHAAAVEQLRGLLTEQKKRQAAFSVGDFKQWTGLSRKLAIPLLEYCDRVRLTRRSGDARVIV